MACPDPEAVHAYLSGLQDRICEGLASFDDGEFSDDVLQSSRSRTRPRILSGGSVLERAAVLLTHARGDSLPAAATKTRPELAGRGFSAASMSLIVHPRNPYAPTTHANLRVFVAPSETSGEAIWWFGGGFDLTPYYGFVEDAVHWHRMAAAACEPFGPTVYADCKSRCDDYFYLPHRREARGVGGLFFDDWTRGGAEESFRFIRSVGDHFLQAYLPILERRYEMPYGDHQRQHQLARRGRYVEFNLLYDRGTRYGLQSGHRVDSVLASMPPLVSWVRPDVVPGSPEEELVAYYLKPKDWLHHSEPSHEVGG